MIASRLKIQGMKGEGMKGVGMKGVGMVLVVLQNDMPLSKKNWYL